MGCAVGLVMSCLKGVQLEHLTLTGLIVCQWNDQEIGANQTHGCATHMVSKELETQARTRQTQSRKYLSATTGKTLMALMPLCFGERFGMVTMVVASRGGKNIGRNHCSGYDDAQYSNG